MEELLMGKAFASGIGVLFGYGLCATGLRFGSDEQYTRIAIASGTIIAVISAIIGIPAIFSAFGFTFI